MKSQCLSCRYYINKSVFSGSKFIEQSFSCKFKELPLFKEIFTSYFKEEECPYFESQFSSLLKLLDEYEKPPIYIHPLKRLE